MLHLLEVLLVVEGKVLNRHGDLTRHNSGACEFVRQLGQLVISSHSTGLTREVPASYLSNYFGHLVIQPLRAWGRDSPGIVGVSSEGVSHPESPRGVRHVENEAVARQGDDTMCPQHCAVGSNGWMQRGT